MNLRSIDLNLLVVLQALLAERNVTKAAQRVGLSQPALSNGLDRLRRLLGDPLLVRRGNRFVLSPRAERLIDPLNRLLADVETVVGLAPQPLAEISQTVTLISGDYALAGLLPALWQWLGQHAPRLALHAKPWPGAAAALQSIVDGDCDLLVAPLEPLPARLHALKLRRSGFVGVARPGHGIGRRPSRERFTAFRHVIVATDGQLPSPIDLVLRPQGIVREAGLVVPSHMLVPGLVAQSDLLGIVPADLVAANPAVVPFSLPFELPDFDGGIVWHERSARDVAVCAVRDAIRDLVLAANAARRKV